MLRAASCLAAGARGALGVGRRYLAALPASTTLVFPALSPTMTQGSSELYRV